jgi:putative hemolysin
MRKKISYSSEELNRSQRFIVNSIERLTGRKKLQKLYDVYSSKKRNELFFWSDIQRLLELKVNIKSDNKFVLPKKGPVIVIANHPYGIVDGIILASFVSKTRSNFKIMTHEVLRFTETSEKYILPVDFSNTNDALKNNINSARNARKLLLEGGVLILFPAGGVAVAKKLNTKAIDAEWGDLVSSLALKTKSAVFPIYFSGKNGLLFHFFASKVKSQTLKYASYLHETKRKIGKQIDIYCGNIIKYEELKEIGNKKSITLFLRDYTMSLNKEGY